MTKQQRRLMIKLLKQAYVKIERGQNTFVCIALRSAAATESLFAKDTRNVNLAHSKLKKWIRRQLNGCGCLETWLIKEQGIDEYEISIDVHYKARRTRLAWIQAMIAELQS